MTQEQGEGAYSDFDVGRNIHLERLSRGLMEPKTPLALMSNR